MKSIGPRSEASDHSGSSFESLATVALDRVDEHPATYDSAFEPSDAMEEDEDDDWEVKGTVTKAAEAAVVSAGRSSGVRPLARNLVDELDDVAKPEPAFGEDDGEDGAKEGLLRAMGCDSQMYPSTMALADWSPTEAATALSNWKKKLRAAFGATNARVATLVFGSTTYLVQTEADPSRVPLPPTPQKGTTEVKGGTFAAKGPASPYMQDSHMVIPRSVDRSDRLAKENEASFTTPKTRRTTVRPPERKFETREESSDSDEDRFDPDYYD
ncbi:hypothetical protein PR002_g27164 [Phytophthora rubi]|nr:hypothetical protein PR002_g27164 [Phytophthora rubi]